MKPTRRHLIAGMAAAVLLPAPAVMAATATRSYAAMLGRTQVGSSTVSLTRQGGSVVADVEARLNINLMGILRYRYALRSREMWQAGTLQRIDASTDNDGRREFASGQRVSQGLQVAGSSFDGIIPGNPATTSYFTTDFLARPVWLSTQNGKPLNLTITPQGAAQFNTTNGTVTASRYACRGDLDIDLFYDADGEWMGSRFSVGPQRAEIIFTEQGSSLTDIWRG